MIKRFIEWLKWFWDTLPPYLFHGPPVPEMPGTIEQQIYARAKLKLQAQYAGGTVPLSKKEWEILNKYGTPIMPDKLQEKKMTRKPKIEYWSTKVGIWGEIDGKRKIVKYVLKWYFHLKASNGAILVTSQGYSSEQACLRGIDATCNAMHGLPHDGEWYGASSFSYSKQAIKIDR